MDGRHRAGHDDGAVPTVGESIIPRPGMRYRTGLGGEPHERPTARCRDRAGAHRRANQSLLHLVAQAPTRQFCGGCGTPRALCASEDSGAGLGQRSTGMARWRGSLGWASTVHHCAIRLPPQLSAHRTQGRAKHERYDRDHRPAPLSARAPRLRDDQPDQRLHARHSACRGAGDPDRHRPASMPAKRRSR